MLSFLLNLPYTLFGLLIAALLVPTRLRFNSEPLALVINVRNDTLGGIQAMRGWRGLTSGHTILLNPREEEKDLAHELIHVKQYSRLPLIFPFLYYIELLRKGYRDNRYEHEAYALSGNVYRAGKEV